MRLFPNAQQRSADAIEAYRQHPSDQNRMAMAQAVAAKHTEKARSLITKHTTQAERDCIAAQAVAATTAELEALV